MKAKLLAWLTGGQVLAWIAGIVVAGFVVLGGWLRIEQLQRQAAEDRAAKAEGERDTARAETRQREGQIAALERQAAVERAVAERLGPIRREIHAAVRTSACVASPVVVRGFERLRASRPAGPAGAGNPDGLPARTGGP